MLYQTKSEYFFPRIQILHEGFEETFIYFSWRSEFLSTPKMRICTSCRKSFTFMAHVILDSISAFDLKGGFDLLCWWYMQVSQSTSCFACGCEQKLTQCWGFFLRLFSRPPPRMVGSSAVKLDFLVPFLDECVFWFCPFKRIFWK